MMIPIAKTRLEKICALYLNHQPRARRISSVALDQNGSANWSVAAVEPRFDLRDVKISFAAVRELQSLFRVIA
jgi:hypothetical protein